MQYKQLQQKSAEKQAKAEVPLKEVAINNSQKENQNVDRNAIHTIIPIR